jgi:hypothetical protein
MNNDFIKRVILLDKAEILLENNKKLTGKQHNKIKSMLNKCWIHIWDFEYNKEINEEYYRLFPEEEE